MLKSRNPSRIAALTALFVVLIPSWVGAQCQITRLLASDATSGDQFGGSIAVAENVIVVGAPERAFDGMDSAGAAYVYRWTGQEWLEEAMLTASDPSLGDRFGQAVAIQGDLLAVGAHLKDEPFTDCGAVYLFRRMDNGTWLEQTVLTASDATAGGHFGFAIAIETDALVVGAPNHVHSGFSFDGVVYVFRAEGTDWTLEAELLGSPEPFGCCSRKLGWSVAMNGNRLIAGAPQFTGSGACFVFDHTQGSWASWTIVSPLDYFIGARFGSAVDIQNDYLLIGAPGDAIAGSGDPEQGAAYVFAWQEVGSAWVQQSKLLPADPNSGAQFGYSAALGPAVHAYVSAPWNNEYGSQAGAVYDFAAVDGTWDQIQKVIPTSLGPSMLYGNAIDCSTTWLATGARIADAVGFTSGEAHAFALGPDCNANDSPDPCEIASLQVTDCNLNGVPDECDIASGTSRDADGDEYPDECLPYFKRGDANVDGLFTIADVAKTLLHLFGDDEAPCLVSFDVNDDEVVNIADAIYTLSALFLGGTLPASPFPACGVDATVGPLQCSGYPPCV